MSLAVPPTRFYIWTALLPIRCSIRYSARFGDWNMVRGRGLSPPHHHPPFAQCEGLSYHRPTQNRSKWGSRRPINGSVPGGGEDPKRAKSVPFLTKVGSLEPEQKKMLFFFCVRHFLTPRPGPEKRPEAGGPKSAKTARSGFGEIRLVGTGTEIKIRGFRHFGPPPRPRASRLAGRARIWLRNKFSVR